uniref:Uncharacterized protein n=1 Tax=Trichuris muris TaxID=70415 RepID=A0A5S6QXP0_TRIMR
MADLYSKFNEMNLHLQGDNVNLISTKTVVCSFIKKLVTFKNDFARGELRQFPKLFEINEEAKIRDEDIEILLAWKSLLGSSIHFQEELVQLQCNEELKPKFKNVYQAFWLQKKIPSLYPRLWAIRCDRSVVKEEEQDRNNRTRLRLTNMAPDLQKLVSLRQRQGSH